MNGTYTIPPRRQPNNAVDLIEVRRFRTGLLAGLLHVQCQRCGKGAVGQTAEEFSAGHCCYA